MKRSDPWLPIGYELPGDVCCQRMVASGEDWQIYDADTGDRLLVATRDLGGRWRDGGLLDADQIEMFEMGPRDLCVVKSRNRYALAAVYDRNSPDSKSDALAFAAAFKSTRAIDATTPLHDAIYVEEFSRLLPTYTITPPAPGVQCIQQAGQ